MDSPLGCSRTTAGAVGSVVVAPVVSFSISSACLEVSRDLSEPCATGARDNGPTNPILWVGNPIFVQGGRSPNPKGADQDLGRRLEGPARFLGRGAKLRT